MYLQLYADDDRGLEGCFSAFLLLLFKINLFMYQSYTRLSQQSLSFLFSPVLSNHL